VGGAHIYASGYPLALTDVANYNVFGGRSPAHITTYEGWLATNDNPNRAGGDRYFAPQAGYAPVALQTNTVLGNATRYNPKAREPWVREDNFSLAEAFQFHERVRMDLRGESFNALNRHV
jgi:hypothetical protein